MQLGGIAAGMPHVVLPCSVMIQRSMLRLTVWCCYSAYMVVYVFSRYPFSLLQSKYRVGFCCVREILNVKDCKEFCTR